MKHLTDKQIRAARRILWNEGAYRSTTLGNVRNLFDEDSVYEVLQEANFLGEDDCLDYGNIDKLTCDLSFWEVYSLFEN